MLVLTVGVVAGQAVHHGLGFGAARRGAAYEPPPHKRGNREFNSVSLNHHDLQLKLLCLRLRLQRLWDESSRVESRRSIRSHNRFTHATDFVQPPALLI